MIFRLVTAKVLGRKKHYVNRNYQIKKTRKKSRKNKQCDSVHRLICEIGSTNGLRSPKLEFPQAGSLGLDIFLLRPSKATVAELTTYDSLQFVRERESEGTLLNYISSLKKLDGQRLTIWDTVKQNLYFVERKKDDLHI